MGLRISQTQQQKKNSDFNQVGFGFGNSGKRKTTKTKSKPKPKPKPKSKSKSKFKYFKLQKSKKRDKKYDAIFETADGKRKVVSFGAAGMSDFTKHKDHERKQRYLKRHKSNEKWGNMTSAGSLAKYILWNKTSLQASKKDFMRKFKLKPLK